MNTETKKIVIATIVINVLAAIGAGFGFAALGLVVLGGTLHMTNTKGIKTIIITTIVTWLVILGLVAGLGVIIGAALL